MSLVLFKMKNYDYKIYAYRLNCSMNIKVSRNQKVPISKQQSKKSISKSIKPLLSPSRKTTSQKQSCNDKANMKLLNQPQKIFQKTKTPPILRRENTQESQSERIPDRNSSYGQDKQKEKKIKDSKKQYYLKQSKKLNSDQQSTNAYRYNKQSADQQQDPYKISSSNAFYKEKSIKPSRDLSISLMCNVQKKSKMNSHKITEHLSFSKDQYASVYELKTKINKKIQSFKSLTKFHQIQNDYFTKKIGISNQEQKRLQKIQLIEINSAKSQIFQLRDEIQNIFKKQK